MDRFCAGYFLMSAGLGPVNLVLNYENQDFSTVLTFILFYMAIAVNMELLFHCKRNLLHLN